METRIDWLLELEPEPEPEPDIVISHTNKQAAIVAAASVHASPYSCSRTYVRTLFMHMAS